MGELTHWKKLENPDYLGAYALTPNQDLIVQIKSVGQEEVYNPSNNKKETCTVARFIDNSIKPMILNVTNCKTISKLYDTPYIEEWTGKYISIYIAKVRAFGDVVEALRIRNKIPTIKQFKCEICGSIITGTNSKTAEEIAAMGKSNYGKELCLKCAKIEQEKMKKEQEGNEVK
ncbi:MAG: hypothetical protein BV456_03540 [Thermoplasmata archaeon M8B2D]|nr:MAG: hypothetical protein BV456_03540 [Thermoplasmata archaeon M8B2D]